VVGVSDIGEVCVKHECEVPLVSRRNDFHVPNNTPREKSMAR
jgi:hypothetical protein